jgi:hypothetical protein
MHADLYEFETTSPVALLRLRRAEKGGRRFLRLHHSEHDEKKGKLG